MVVHSISSTGASVLALLPVVSIGSGGLWLVVQDTMGNRDAPRTRIISDPLELDCRARFILAYSLNLSYLVAKARISSVLLS